MIEIRCSGLARPMQCAGSLFFTELPRQEESQPAKEGTACGEYLRFMLENDMREPTDSCASNGIAFDEDMRQHSREVAARIFERANGQVSCEQRIDWHSGGNVVIRGQYDASFVGKDGALYIDDLKYGWSIVEVKENWQLLGYAIGEVIRRATPFEQIVLRIHQPRPHHEDGPTREWRLTYPELLAYKARIDTRMAAISEGFNVLETGPKCKYCPAAGEHCPALNRAFWQGVDVVHEFMQDKVSDTELARQLDLIGRIAEIMKIKQDSLEALAVSRLGNGSNIPGYTMTARYGDRKWRKGVDPETIKVLTGKEVVEQVMLSPAKVEKLGVPREFVNALVERQFLGQKLMRANTTELGNKIFGDPNGKSKRLA